MEITGTENLELSINCETMEMSHAAYTLKDLWTA